MLFLSRILLWLDFKSNSVIIEEQTRVNSWPGHDTVVPAALNWFAEMDIAISGTGVEHSPNTCSDFQRHLLMAGTRAGLCGDKNTLLNGAPLLCCRVSP